MKKRIAFGLVILAFLTTSCLTTSSGLRRDLLPEPEKLDGTYDLILIGGAYPDDPERIIIYDIPGDGYEFQPVTEKYKIKRISALSAQAALKKTREFFSEHCAYNGFVTKELVLVSNGSIGYELVPDYPTILCERGNEVTVSYSRENNGVIKVSTWLVFKEHDDDDRGGRLKMRP